MNLLRPPLIICVIGLAAAAAMIAGVFGPWQETWEEGAPGDDSTTTSGMSYGSGWLLVGAALIGAVGLVAFARGWRFAPWVTVIVGLGAVLLARPGGRIEHSALDASYAANRWGYGVTLSASLLMLGAGLFAAIGGLVDWLERLARRRNLES